MLKKVKILEIKPLEKGNYIKSQLVVAERDGEKVFWEMVKAHDSVHVSVYNKTTDEYIFVEQVRIPYLVNNPSTNGQIVECCAGLVDKDYDIQQIAKEEILEELGYDIPKENIHFIKSIRSAVGRAGNTAHTYYTEVTEDDRVSDGGGLDNEDIAVIRVPRDDINSFIMNTETDSTTLFLTQYHIKITKGI